jgi:hypothetical protein
MAVKTDLAAMSIQFLKDQRDRTKQNQLIDKNQNEGNKSCRTKTEKHTTQTAAKEVCTYAK